MNKANTLTPFADYGWKDAEKKSHHDYLLPSIMSLMPKKGRLNILDAGCGNGWIAGQLSALGHSVVAIDESPDGIAFARAKWRTVQWDVVSIYDDLTELMPAGGWDLVVSSEVIEHLFYPQRFLQNMNSVLKEDGGIIITTPYHGYFKNCALSIVGAWDRHLTVDLVGGHIKFFSEETLARMLKQNGFETPIFCNAGRLPYLWKSMVCFARKSLCVL
jgi:2-polyprenyl-3-methyl-5-hydroxy-6-metoxy-1,4-benzoquinol methylase